MDCELLKSSLVLDEDDDILFLADIEKHEILYVNKKNRLMFSMSPDSKEDLVKKYDEILQRKDMVSFLNDKNVRLVKAVDFIQKEDQQTPVQNQTVEKTLVACIRTLAESRENGSALNRILERIANFYSGERAYIFEINVHNNTFTNTYEWCQKDLAAEIDNLKSLPLNLIDDWIPKFNNEGIIYSSSIGDEIDSNRRLKRNSLKKHGVQSLLTAPLIWDGALIGFLGVDNPNRNIQELTLLRSITYFIMDEIEKRKNIKMLERISFFDALTNLANRDRYMEDIHYLEMHPPKYLGVVYMDLNGIKVANDTYGHEYGDQLLLGTADILKSIFENNIYRIGGDEFVVLCIGMERIKFQKSVAMLRLICQEDENISTSIGAHWTTGKTDVLEQIAYADKLMYLEKQSYYQSQPYNLYNHRSALAKELQESIANGDYIIHLQPIVDLADMKIIGAEALIRKQMKGGILLKPDKFIPLLEKENLICRIDLYVLQLACEVLVKWEDMGRRDMKINVNFSRYTLMEYNVLSQVCAVCDNYQIDYSSIEIEVTESIDVMDAEELYMLVESFRQVGFSVSLDDFGSKYANLALLSTVSFDRVKFDKSLVDQIEGKNDVRIIHHAIALCNDLDNVNTLAEGVETRHQLNVLKGCSCDYAQGYLFSEPISVEEFTEKYIARG